MLARISFVLLAVVIGALAAQAAPTDDAFAAYQKGDANAQYNLGAMYANALGVSQNHEEAAKWFKLAAAKGNVFATVDLAVLYENGQGVQKDYTEAMRLFMIAAEKKSNTAEANIAAMFERGLGKPQSYSE